MKTFNFPVGKLSIPNRIIALNKIKESYEDAEANLEIPFKIKATIWDCNEIGDAEYYFGLCVGKAIQEVLLTQD